MDLLGELGSFVDGSRLLLSAALGRVESFPMPLAMLLDVLVLGHLCLLGGRGGGVVGALPASPRACCRLQRSPGFVGPHGERWLLLRLRHAYPMAVVSSEVRCMSDR